MTSTNCIKNIFTYDTKVETFSSLAQKVLKKSPEQVECDFACHTYPCRHTRMVTRRFVRLQKQSWVVKMNRIEE